MAESVESLDVVGQPLGVTSCCLQSLPGLHESASCKRKGLLLLLMIQRVSKCHIIFPPIGKSPPLQPNTHPSNPSAPRSEKRTHTSLLLSSITTPSLAQTTALLLLLKPPMLNALSLTSIGATSRPSTLRSISLSLRTAHLRLLGIRTNGRDRAGRAL